MDSEEYYYYHLEGSIHGPISLDDLRTLHTTRALSPEVQICRIGTEEWIPLSVKLARHTSESNQGQNQDTLPGIAIVCYIIAVLSGIVGLFVIPSILLSRDSPDSSRIAIIGVAIFSTVLWCCIAKVLTLLHLIAKELIIINKKQTLVIDFLRRK